MWISFFYKLITFFVLVISWIVINFLFPELSIVTDTSLSTFLILVLSCLIQSLFLNTLEYFRFSFQAKNYAVSIVLVSVTQHIISVLLLVFVSKSALVPIVASIVANSTMLIVFGFCLD